MPDQDKNVDFFLRSVKERFGKLQGDFKNLTATLTAENIQEKRQAAKVALDSTNAMLEIISTEDQPGWLTTLKSELERYHSTFNSTGASNRLIQHLLEIHSPLRSHKWQFEQSKGAKAIEFENIFNEYYKNSRLTELFDNLLENLLKIVDSGEVDSLRAINALNTLISTIRANMRGTYFQTVGTTRFAQAVFKNYLREILKSIPGIGPMVNAVEQSMKELDDEMNTVHSDVRQRLSKDAFGEVPSLSYEKSGEKLPNK